MSNRLITGEDLQKELHLPSKQSLDRFLANHKDIPRIRVAGRYLYDWMDVLQYLKEINYGKEKVLKEACEETRQCDSDKVLPRRNLKSCNKKVAGTSASKVPGWN